MIRNWILGAALLFAAGAGFADEPMSRTEVSAAAKDGVTFIGNDDVLARIEANPDLLLIDVRSESDFNLARMPGAASVPRGVAEFRIAGMVRDAETEIIVYCSSGNRAALVKKALEAQGYRNVSAHEGFANWADAGHLVENDHGTFQLIEAAGDD